MTSLDRPDRDRSLAAAVPETQDPPAPAVPAGAMPARPRPRRTWIAAIAGVLILPIAVAAVLTYTAAGSDDRAAIAAAARVVSAADMESEFGVRVSLVAVTANGGLVDVRFTVVDKDKAGHILHDSASMPELFVEKSGAVLTTRNPMAHKALTLLDGATYFLLYPNSGGVIQRGTPVSVVIDGIRLAPIDAQS